MSVALTALTALIAVAAAVRSIWSPCGLSMLSTITPMAETGRGHRFRSTALWFVAGSVAGGVTLGGLMALLALGVGGLETAQVSALWLAAVAALVAAASDGRIGGFHLPGHDRQVNERWLDQYRSWVYGAGFGWQIGVGLATYIMTAGVYLLILMGSLIADPLVAIGLGGLFGLVRGLAVFLATDLDSGDKLLAFHARFETWREPIRQAMVMIQAMVAVIAVGVTGTRVGIVALVAAVAMLIVVMSLRGTKEAVYLNAVPSLPA